MVRGGKHRSRGGGGGGWWGAFGWGGGGGGGFGWGAGGGGGTAYNPWTDPGVWASVWGSIGGQFSFDPNSSGLAQIQQSGGGTGWESAYWAAIGVSAAADAVALGAIISGVDPWLGDIAIHGSHAGGPHQFPHIQIMIRVAEHVTKIFRIPLP